MNRAFVTICVLPPSGRMVCVSSTSIIFRKDRLRVRISMVLVRGSTTDVSSIYASGTLRNWVSGKYPQAPLGDLVLFEEETGGADDAVRVDRALDNVCAQHMRRKRVGVLVVNRQGDLVPRMRKDGRCRVHFHYRTGSTGKPHASSESQLAIPDFRPILSILPTV